METSLQKQIKRPGLFSLRHSLFFYSALFMKIILTTIFISPPFFWGPSILISIGLYFLPFSILLLLRGKIARSYFYVLNLLTTLLLLSDCLYNSYFHSPPSVYTLFQFHNLSGLSESVFYILDIKYLIFFIDLLFLPFLHKRVIFKANPKLFVLFFLSGIIIFLASPLKNFHSDENDIFRRFDNRDSFNYLGPIGYHLLDTMFYFKNLNQDLTTEEKDAIEAWFQKQDNSVPEIQAEEYKGIGKGKNLILIQVESLQNFVIHQTVGDQEITPNLNRLLKNSLYFTQIYPQTIEGNSSDAEFLVNTSLFPLEKGSVYFRYPHNTYLSLPLMMKNEGYHTFAIHADEASFWNRAQVYPSLGFGQFHDIQSFHMDEEMGMGLSDRSMFRQSIGILKEQKHPYYSFIITLTSHMPFAIPDHNKKLALPRDMSASYLGDYFQSIRYTDESIGEFIHELETRNMLQNSIIVFYGDHDGIFEKDKPLVEEWVKHSISPEEWVRHYTNIPFIIYNPSLEGKTIDITGGQIDIMPTLLHIMGIDNEKIKHSAMGKNLFSREEGTVIIPSGDYIKKSAFITRDKVLELNEDQLEALKVSRLIIEGNYFKK